MQTLQQFEKQTVFATGTENTAYSKYFVGKSYLNMLTSEKVPIGNVTFEPGCRNNWHIHHKGGQILLVKRGADGIRNGESPRAPFLPAMSS